MSKKEYGEIGVKKDCFAYCKIGTLEKCNALKFLYCKQEECKFYKTVEQHKRELNKYRIV